MAVRVVHRHELTFWEKIYLPQILCGLKITFTHFFRNLFLHTAHLLGRFKHLPASATIQFPEELRPLISASRAWTVLFRWCHCGLSERSRSTCA